MDVYVFVLYRLVSDLCLNVADSDSIRLQMMDLCRHHFQHYQIVIY